MNNPGFEWLAQGIENGGSEFCGFVEKQNPSVSE